MVSQDEFVERLVEFEATGFSPAQVAAVVKAAFVSAHPNYGEGYFTPGELTRICALAGLSEQQTKALYKELI